MSWKPQELRWLGEVWPGIRLSSVQCPLNHPGLPRSWDDFRSHCCIGPAGKKQISEHLGWITGRVWGSEQLLMTLSLSSEDRKGSPGKRMWCEQPLGNIKPFSLLKDRLRAVPWAAGSGGYAENGCCGPLEFGRCQMWPKLSLLCSCRTSQSL